MLRTKVKESQTKSMKIIEGEMRGHAAFSSDSADQFKPGAPSMLVTWTIPRLTAMLMIDIYLSFQKNFHRFPIIINPALGKFILHSIRHIRMGEV